MSQVLCINRLNLPDEILSIIKDYALLSLERKAIMDTHKKIHSIVMENGIFEDEYSKEWFYWRGKFNSKFCLDCGDYLLIGLYTGDELTPAICKC